jgi:hypothetical protein
LLSAIHEPAIPPVSRHGGLSWYDEYRVDDFALNPAESLSQPANSVSTLVAASGGSTARRTVPPPHRSSGRFLAL